MSARARLRSGVQRVKRALPGPVSDLARSAAIGWGFVTSDLRMKPGMILVGAQRCGTTTMFRALSDHPDVRRPPVSKGVGYFDEQFTEHGMRWYRGHFPIAVLAGRRADGAAPMTFDSSGYTSFHPLAASRIARTLPGARALLMIRDPAERAFSAFKHESARGFETETFERALELEPERLAGELEKMVADPTYASFHHRHHAYVGRGEYATQIERLQRELGKDQVFVMDADHFFARPVEQFAAVTTWLGLSDWSPDDIPQWNARPSTPMDPAIRARLLEHFEPHDAALENLTGRVPSWREDTKEGNR